MRHRYIELIKNRIAEAERVKEDQVVHKFKEQHLELLNMLLSIVRNMDYKTFYDGRQGGMFPSKNYMSIFSYNGTHYLDKRLKSNDFIASTREYIIDSLLTD